MDLSQEDFGRACGDVVALLTEHGDGHADGPRCGVHGSLRVLGLDPTRVIDVAEEIASFGLDELASSDARSHGGLAFITGLLVGVQLAQAGRGGGEAG